MTFLESPPSLDYIKYQISKIKITYENQNHFLPLRVKMLEVKCWQPRLITALVFIKQG